MAEVKCYTLVVPVLEYSERWFGSIMPLLYESDGVYIHPNGALLHLVFRTQKKRDEAYDKWKDIGIEGCKQIKRVEEKYLKKVN